MSTVGMILIVAWVMIGLLSPIIGLAADKLRGVSNDSESKVSTGYHDTRVSGLMIVIYSTPLLFVGLALNYLGS